MRSFGLSTADSQHIDPCVKVSNQIQCLFSIKKIRSLTLISTLSCYVVYQDVLSAFLEQAVVEMWLLWQNPWMQTVAVEMDSLIIVPVEYVQIALVIMWVVNGVIGGRGEGY